MHALRIVGLLLFCAAPALAATDPAARCCNANLRASASQEAKLFRCQAKAAGRGTAVSPSCVAAVAPAVSESFGRGTCATAGDAARVADVVVATVQDVADSLRPSQSASGCAARKLKGASHFAATVLRAYGRNALSPDATALDAALAKASAELGLVFARAVAPGECLTTGDVEGVKQIVLQGGTPRAGVLVTLGAACPTCGDTVRAGTEQCDSIEDAACEGACTGSCTCAVCGNDVIEPGEQCEGNTCFIEGIGSLGCSGDGPDGCRCCGDPVCQFLGCCDASELCLVPEGLPQASHCFPTRCGSDEDCDSDFYYTCVDDPDGSPRGFCYGKVGAVCRQNGIQLVPCVSPSVCADAPNVFCCLPPGEQCGDGQACCSGTCTAGTCG